MNFGCVDDEKDDKWYLNTRATNHMLGCQLDFAKWDTSVKVSVKFGDGSNVEICGRGMVLFTCHTGEHRELMNVYYIPWLSSNIISVR